MRTQEESLEKETACVVSCKVKEELDRWPGALDLAKFESNRCGIEVRERDEEENLTGMFIMYMVHVHNPTADVQIAAAPSSHRLLDFIDIYIYKCVLSLCRGGEG